MQTVKITVVERRHDDEKLVETRFVDVETDRRLTGLVARRILRHQFPEIGEVFIVSKTESGWTIQKALKPGECCEYHFVWRHYNLMPA
ncbi:hypothetical protein ABAC460_03555 [Asticcacaulis sp. AC460]|uniref:hypothetical protein n=1 Tax=Asticcacaulis sp. AC460 TaxID=1282360 RepID=UPI0003C3C34F|nr:hypothetical protein [Asticcacaulis sp. AC460]ESQ91985.1 hypothetical protein ABAC460_03555 [Asticcacaulis sp. AC460]